MTGFKIYREIFASLPAIDDRLTDLTQEQRDDYIKRLFENTQTVLRQGVLVPVKEGHNTKNSERLHGHLSNVDLKFKSNPSPHYVLVGEVFLDDEYYELFKSGQLPAVSVEIADSANLSAYTGNPEDRVGQYVVGVALCGTNPVAMPQLEVIREIEAQPSAIYIRLVGEKIYNFKKFEVHRMDSMKEKLMNAMMKFIEDFFATESGQEAPPNVELMPKDQVEAAMRQKFEDASPAETTAEEPPPAEKKYEQQSDDALLKEKDAEIEMLKAKLAAQEDEAIEKEFQLLATDGKVTPEEKAHFTRIAKHEGRKFAREVYSRKASNPVVGRQELIQSVDTVDNNKRLRQTYRNMGLTDAEIDKTFERMQKRVKQAV